MVETLIQFLVSKEIIQVEDIKKFFDNNYQRIFNNIIERDKKEKEEYLKNLKEGSDK